MAESFDMGSLIEEFRDEARDQIDRLDAGLLELERTGELGAESRSALLRTLHTLKGNAGMLGLSAIRDYVHVVENVLKVGVEHWPASQIERLFEGAAALRHAVESAGGDDQEAAARRLGAARHRLEEADTQAPPRTEAAEPEPEPESAGSTDVLRVPFIKLDRLLNEVGELLGEADALLAAMDASDGGDGAMARDHAEAIRRRADRLRETAMSLRLVPIGRVLGRFPGLVRRLAGEQGKEARLVLEGESTEVDKSTADALAEPLLHLIRNAIDHGIETPAEREAAGKPRHGTITIRALHHGDRILLEVLDDGAGLPLPDIAARGREMDLVGEDEELTEEQTADLIFRPGFSTRTEVSTVSGRGVGLDVVRRTIRVLRGDLAVRERPEGGTLFRISLPLTVAIVPSLVFRAAGELMALPATSIRRTLRVDRIERVGRTEVVRDGEDLIPLARPGRLFGWEAGTDGQFAVVVRQGARKAALLTERLVDQRDLVVKALPSYGPRAPGLSGASVLPGGRVILLLDAAELIELNLHHRERSAV